MYRAKLIIGPLETDGTFSKFRTRSDPYLSKKPHIPDLVKETHWETLSTTLIKTKENKDAVLEITVQIFSPFFPSQKGIF